MRRRLAVIVCLATLLLPFNAVAHADAVSVTIVSQNSADNGDGTAEVVIVARSTAPCTAWSINMAYPKPVPGGNPKRRSGGTTLAVFDFPLVEVQQGTNVDLTHKTTVHAHCGLLVEPTSDPVAVFVPQYAPVNVRVGEIKVMQSSNSAKDKKKAGAKKAAAPTKQRPKRQLLDVAGSAAPLLTAVAAREVWIAGLMTSLNNLPEPTGSVSQTVVAGAGPPLPPLPTDLPAPAVAAVQAVLANQGEQIALGGAAVEALSRQGTALSAGDAVDAAKRAVDAAGLLERWASVLGAEAGLDATAQAAIAPLVSTESFTDDDLDAIAGSPTLPADIAAAVATLGAPQEVSAQLQVSIDSLTTSDLTDYTPSLVDPQVASDDVQTALAFRTLAAALRAPGDGPATSPPPGRRITSGVGQLRRTGCVSASPAKGSGCVKGVGLAGAKFAATSPDGRFVYVGGDGPPGAIAVFARNLRTGALSQLKGKAGCYSSDITGCTVIPHSGRVADLVVTGDGHGVVAALSGDGAVVSFARNATTGALRWVGCVGAVSGCKKAPGGILAGVKVVAVSPDSRNVYASAVNGGDVVELTRNPRTGALAGLGCIGPTTGCAAARAIKGPAGVTVSRDGGWVYEADQSQWAVSALRRDARTGRLTDAGCVAGRDGVSTIPGCTASVGLAGPEWVTAGPGGSVWVGSSESSSVIRLTRADDGSLAMADAAGACTTDLQIAFATASLCTGQPGLGGAYGIAVSPDGLNAYVGGYDPGSVGAFQVDPVSGALIGVGTCSGAATSGCAKAAALAHAGHVVLTPDGRNVLVLAPGSSSVVSFARRLIPSTVVIAKAATLHHGRITATVSCPVTAAAWCYGSWTAALLTGNKVVLRVKAQELVVRPGARLHLVVLVPAATVVNAKSRLRLVATSKEPFGAKATAKKDDTIHRG